MENRFTPKTPDPGRGAAMVIVLLLMTGCQSGPAAQQAQWDKLVPQTGVAANDRDWIVEHKVLASAEMQGDQVTVHNVRDAEFFTYRDCVVDYYDQTFKLGDVQNVDFIVIPFNENRALAHTL